MGALTAIGVLAGIMLGLFRCKVLILLPGVLTATVLIMWEAVAGGGSLSLVVLSALVVIVGLQAGYVCGLTLRTAFIEPRGSRHPPIPRTTGWRQRAGSLRKLPLGTKR